LPSHTGAPPSSAVFPPNAEIGAVSRAPQLVLKELRHRHRVGIEARVVAMSALREARVVLQPSEEWRFEVDYGSQGIVSLLDGHAEIFGTELIAERRYTFSGVKLAVFTWHGCTLEVEGTFSHQYTAHETPMIGVLQLHEELEQQRNTALATLSPGPRVMVVGSDDCGKTTMCRILANYAARRGHGVTYVDLDVGQQLFGPPGTISATAWHQPLDLELRGEFAAPLAYWLGHHSIVDHIALFRHAIGSMRTVLDKLMRAHLGARMAGMILNSCGWVDGDGYDALVFAAETLGVDTFVVIADDRLYSRLSTYFAHRDVRVLRAPKTGGVVVQSKAFKHECRMESLRSYFYGIGGQLCPHSTVLSFSSTTLMAIESAPPPPADTLPIGAIAPRHAVRAVKLGVKSWPGMLKAILAVSFAQSGDDENSVLAANIAGIVFVTNVDVENGRVTVLAPSPVAFPGGVLLAGSIKWLEAR